MIKFTTLKDTGDINKLAPCYVCNSINVTIAYEDSIYRVLRCSNCGLHFVNPIPTYKDVTSHHSDILYKEGSDIIQIEKQKVRAMITAGEIITLFRKRRISGNRLLDIGCGYGFFLKNLSRYKWEVYGCEQNINAKEYAEKMGLTIYQDLKHENLWREDFYDVITLWNVLEHLDDPFKLLCECQRLLRKGGVIIVRVPNVFLEHILWRRGKYPNYMQIPLHLFGFTIPSLISLLRRAGFVNSCVIPSPLGDKSYSIGKRYGPVKAKLMIKFIEYLNFFILKLTFSRLPGFLSITIIANRPMN
jgi:2-polyprenyl-3-methyl-5-hydroxy-6-metoxy-1,4-benzoquinol methylase